MRIDISLNYIFSYDFAGLIHLAVIMEEEQIEILWMAKANL
jgi:hypothetical protein